jgi:NAD(P)-dependent dehydrogenase (short-subunit alcohol dehydrogenase family)
MRYVVMTGATAGLGSHALKHFVAQPDVRAIVGARGAGPQGANVDVIPLDLASFASVRSFAESAKPRLGADGIEMLVLNAGAQYPNAEQRSAEGFEMTFAVNHLAHYLLARLLVQSLARGARLVITASDAHDPAIIPFGPKVLDVAHLAQPRPGRSEAMRAYPASKLCNILTARKLAELPEVKERAVRVVAYNPGLTPGTSLVRASPFAQVMIHSRLLHVLLSVASRFKPALYPGTPERAGEALAQLTLGTVRPPDGRIYASLVRGEITFPDPSELARSDEARDRLWRESAALVGVSS